MINETNNKLDFRLNKSYFKEFVQNFLENASQQESIDTRSNITYSLIPGGNFMIKYGVHHHANAGETKNGLNHDICTFQINKFENGYNLGTFWLSISVSNFKCMVLGYNILQKNNYVLDEFKMDCDYYQFMAQIFGEKYLQALSDFLNCEFQKIIKKENISYLNKLKNASSDGKNSRQRKSDINKSHQFRRAYCLDFYKSRMNFIESLLNVSY